MNTKNTKFFGWKVVAGCFLLSFFAVSVVGSTAALFMAPICQEFGFSIAAYSFVNLIGSLCSAGGAMWLAPKMQRGNMNRIMVICSVVTCLAYMGMAFCTKMWQFYIVFGICNIAVSGLTQLPIAMMITAWFQDRRSTAMSIAFAGDVCGIMLWAKIFGILMTRGTHGWADCYLLGGILVGIVCVLISLLLAKKAPALFGQEPYTLPVSTATKDSPEKSVTLDEWIGLSRREAVKTIPFVMMATCVVLIDCMAAGVATHYINYLVSIGWDIREASTIMSVSALAALPSYLIVGPMFDRLGLRIGTLLSVLFCGIGIASLNLAQNHLFGFAFAIGFALSCGLPRVLPATLTASVFGTKDYGSIYSLLNLFFLVGCSIGSVVTAIIAQAVGYRIAWIFHVVLTACIFITVSAALTGGKRLREQPSLPVDGEQPSTPFELA